MVRQYWPCRDGEVEKPKAMVKIPAGATKWRYLKYWYPDGRTPGLVIFVR